MTLYVQYAKSSKFQNLLYGTDSYIGLNSLLNVNWEDFYNDTFNILTCNSVGLGIWGGILNITRNYTIGTRDRTFGLNVNPGNTTGYAQNFNHGTFYNGTGVFSILPDGEYRCLLILAARTKISNLSILSITSLLNDFFLLLQEYGNNDNNHYDWVVNVSADDSNHNQLNYQFKHMSGDISSFPQWIAYIFSTINIATNTFHLPLPLGTRPNITFI